jgi:D-alanyl-D-alanine carboxypeptidase/D-alanyl-D-alanine-endopeptidase (penicillin-binding protein 4)
MRLLLPILLLSCWCRGQEALLKEWSADSGLQGATITFCVMDASTGKLISAVNESLSVIPASTLKIFTTGCALKILGKEFRYETAIAYSGTFDIKSGIVSGDLLVIGSGDPTLQSEHFIQGSTCEAWAEELYRKGVREIKGDIAGHAGKWQRVIPDHWIWGDVDNYFGAVPCGLNYRDNKYEVTFSSGAEGSEARVIVYKPKYQNQNITLTTSVVCAGDEDKASFYGDPFLFSHTIRGSIPASRGKFSIEGALPDPALLCAEELLVALKKKGIKCHGKTKSSFQTTTGSYQVLFTHKSVTLDKIVQHTNKRSDNLYCESLLLTLGEGNREKGLETVRKFWREQGLNETALFMADGSGLSRASTCTSKLLCDALVKIYNDPSVSAAFDASLPRAGKEGSMGNVGRGTEIENNLRAKTGYIQRVRAYAGYVKTREGNDLAFSIVFNQFNCSPSEARKKMEKFMVMLPAFSNKK